MTSCPPSSDVCTKYLAIYCVNVIAKLVFISEFDLRARNKSTDEARLVTTIADFLNGYGHSMYIDGLMLPSPFATF